MSAFDKLRSLKMRGAIRALIYGPPKIGKTTLASEFPSPVFLQFEDGQNASTETVGWGQEDLQSYEDVNDKLRALYEEPHDYKTLVIDNVSRLQWVVWAETCRRGDDKKTDLTTIEEFGYGKGYQYAIYVWQELLDGMNTLRVDRGMHIILLGHSRVEKFDDPDSVSYDRYEIDLHKSAVKLLEREMDCLLLVKQEVSVKQEDKGFQKKRAIGEGINRFIYTAPRPAFIAGNRLANMPAKLKFDKGKGFAAIEPYLPDAPTRAANPADEATNVAA